VHTAQAKSGNVHDLAEILAAGCDPQSLGTALALASGLGHSAFVGRLLEAGIRPDAPWTLHLACMAGHADLVQLFITHPHHAPLDTQPDSRGLTPLMAAAKSGHVQCAQLLLDHKADVDKRNAERRTALDLALLGPPTPGKQQCATLLMPSVVARDVRSPVKKSSQPLSTRQAILVGSHPGCLYRHPTWTNTNNSRRPYSSASPLRAFLMRFDSYCFDCLPRAP